LRRELAAAYVAKQQVRVDSCCTQDKVKTRRLKTPDGPVHRQITFRDWHVSGAVGEYEEVQVVINDTGSIIFGRCACPFFDANLLQQGPCEHILALFQASTDQRIEQPTSVAAVSPESKQGVLEASEGESGSSPADDDEDDQ
jgi:hypothetical protein